MVTYPTCALKPGMDPFASGTAAYEDPNPEAVTVARKHLFGPGAGYEDLGFWQAQLVRSLALYIQGCDGHLRDGFGRLVLPTEFLLLSLVQLRAEYEALFEQTPTPPPPDPLPLPPPPPPPPPPPEDNFFNHVYCLQDSVCAPGWLWGAVAIAALVPIAIVAIQVVQRGEP